MIIVSGTIELDPANVDAALAVIAPLVADTLAEEGCDDYGFWSDPTTPGRFRIFEQWADQDALDAHFATPHMAAFMGAIGGLGVSSTDILKYEVSASSKLM